MTYILYPFVCIYILLKFIRDCSIPKFDENEWKLIKDYNSF